MSQWARIRAVFRSKSDQQLDTVHAESRAEIARLLAEGRGREGLDANAKLLGLSRDSQKRPKMIFDTKQ